MPPLKSSVEKKVHVTIIRPYGVCSCSVGPWLSAIWDVLRKYKPQVRYTVKDTTSQEAKQFRLTSRSIIVDGDQIIKSGSAQELDLLLQNRLKL